jgi:CHAT domain-containing protein
MHGLLMAPMEAALKRAGARTLMVSLDGPLRSLPFAALHDGQHWLMTRYAVNVYTTASPAALSQVPAKPWRAAAFGSSEGGAGLQALPGVRQELEAIVSDPSRTTGGAMPGTIALNQAFTAQSLQAVALTTASGQARQPGTPNLLHIASHFVFKPSDPGASFLLLGDGQRLTLSELAQPGWRFDHLNLLTLSACQTARSGDDPFGQEIEGLGTLLQAQGAAAVLASLWQVNDAATARLMQQLYLQLQSQPGVNKAEALRRAQQAMVEPGTSAVPVRTDKPQGTALPQPARGIDLDELESPPTPAQATFAHPYYWAPFVLMGNWL